MSKPVRRTDPATPTLPDPGTLMAGPLTAMHLWADMQRNMSSVMPASLLIATSPFFWAPPLWVGALMAARAATAAPKRTVAPLPPTPAPPPPRRAAHPRGRRASDS